MLEGNKEGLVFEGVWTTRKGFKVNVKNGLAKILESPVPYLKNMLLPIDAQGKCITSSDFDLIERDRTTEGYML